MTEQTIAIVSFTGALKREVTKMQKRLSKVESINYLYCNIEVRGRLDGDIKITYKVCDNEYGHETIKGNDLDAVAEELMRRHGWDKRNAPLMLTSNERQRADADRLSTNDSDPVQPPKSGDGTDQDISF